MSGTRKATGKAGSSAEQRLRRLLAAAAAREDEVPRLDPFFMTRLHARLLAPQPRSALASLAHSARTMLLPLAATALVLVTWAGWQSIESARLSRALPPSAFGLADVLLAAALGGVGPSEGGGR